MVSQADAESMSLMLGLSTVLPLEVASLMIAPKVLELMRRSCRLWMPLWKHFDWKTRQSLSVAVVSAQFSGASKSFFGLLALSSSVLFPRSESRYLGLMEADDANIQHFQPPSPAWEVSRKL